MAIRLGARIDLILAKINEYEWAAVVIKFLNNPPPWFIFPASIIGLLLIWLDISRRQKAPSTDQANLRVNIGEANKLFQVLLIGVVVFPFSEITNIPLVA